MSAPRRNWHEDVFFGLHYDLHARETDTELGKELTPEYLEERLLRVRPDWIQCDCKGHPGWTSWPTEVGSTSPGVVKDALRIHRDVTKKLGIRLGMHYSGVWDTRAVTLHPEWACIGPDGAPSPDITCRLSGYTEELMIPQMLELVDKYDVDGFWVDGENWGARPCWCDRCRVEFTRRTGLDDIPHDPAGMYWHEWLAFHRDLFIEHVTKYADAVHARKPDCLVCSNWMYTLRQPEAVSAPVDYLSGDYSWVWGADRAAVEGRMLDSRNMTWDLMAWGFLKSGDMRGPIPWAFKTLTHLCQELVEVVALGGAVMVYNTPQRSGRLTDWHQDRLGQAAEFCRARKDVCFRSKTVPQAAILHLADHYYRCNAPLFNYGAAVEPLEGALHGLLETQHTADILTEDAALDRLDGYRLAVLPELGHLSADVLSKLEAFARAGGHVILSGAHLAAEYPELVGATAATDEPCPEGTVYLPAGEEAVGAFGPWARVEPAEGTEVWAWQLAQQEPELDATGWPAVTCRKVGEGSIVAVHGPLFRNYFQTHYPGLRQFIREMLERLDIPWMVTVDAPPRLEMILRTKDGKLVVNLINRGAGEMLNPHRVIVEELVPVQDVTLRVRLEAPPQSVAAVPDEGALDWTYGEGLLTVQVPQVDIHLAVVIEPGS